MSLTPYDAYRWGKRSAERLVEALRRFMETGDATELAPYLAAGPADPGCVGELEEKLAPLFAWMSLKWAYKPSGPPPSRKLPVVVEVLCKAGIPLDESVIREIMPEESAESEHP